MACLASRGHGWGPDGGNDGVRTSLGIRGSGFGIRARDSGFETENSEHRLPGSRSRSRIPESGVNDFIANAPGCHESITSGNPQRVSPISAWRRAMSVETCSGVGSGRVSSENCTTRAGVGSTATVTRSMAAAGGFDSRSSNASVRSVRESRIGTGNCSDRSCTSRVVPSVLIKCSRTCSTAAPRSRCTRCASSDSISRPSTNDSGSSSSIGHSSSSVCSNRSSGTEGTSGRPSSPRARHCQSVS